MEEYNHVGFPSFTKTTILTVLSYLVGSNRAYFHLCCSWIPCPGGWDHGGQQRPSQVFFSELRRDPQGTPAISRIKSHACIALECCQNMSEPNDNSAPHIWWNLLSFLRPWSGHLYKKMTKVQREKLLERLLKTGKRLVRIYIDKNGRRRVSMS